MAALIRTAVSCHKSCPCIPYAKLRAPDFGPIQYRGNVPKPVEIGVAAILAQSDNRVALREGGRHEEDGQSQRAGANRGEALLLASEFLRYPLDTIDLLHNRQASLISAL
jgi:hypothetical protein